MKDLFICTQRFKHIFWERINNCTKMKLAVIPGYLTIARTSSLVSSCRGRMGVLPR